MSELTSLTLAEARDRLRRREFSAVELADAHLAAMEKARALNAYVLGDARARSRHGGGRGCAPGVRRRPPARRPCASGSRTVRDQGRAHHRRLAHPRQFRADLRIDRHRQSLARRRGDARQAQQRRVRHGLVQRDLVFRPGDLALAAEGVRIRRWCRAAPRAVRLRRWRPDSASARPARTPAARSASRRRSPASSGSSRPMAAARAGASWRLRPRSTRRDRSRARCATPRSCSRRWRATTPRTRPRSIARCRTTKRRSANRSRA